MQYGYAQLRTRMTNDLSNGSSCGLSLGSRSCFCTESSRRSSHVVMSVRIGSQAKHSCCQNHGPTASFEDFQCLRSAWIAITHALDPPEWTMQIKETLTRGIIVCTVTTCELSVSSVESIHWSRNGPAPWSASTAG